MNTKIEQFYIVWKANLDDYLRGYAFDRRGIKKKPRFIFSTLSAYLNKFVSNKLPEDERIILMPGIRGVGKTTLLSQLYFFDEFIQKKSSKISAIDYKFYISVDRLIYEGMNLKDFFEFLQAHLNNFENKKVLLLIDEIQYDPDWALFLKLFYDQTKNKDVLLFATGSSALLLNQQNKDLVRRTVSERILPESFSEYLFLHKGILLSQDLSSKIKKAVFYSQNAKEAYARLNRLRKQVTEVLSQIKNLQANKKDYLLRGSFPFSAEIQTQSLAMERIKNMVLINIVQRDLILTGDFDAETLIKIPNLLFLLANSDEITVGKLSKILHLSNNTTNKILDSLSKSEILFELKPYGQPYVQVRKSGKFLFITPNLRAGLLEGVIGASLKGKLLEDYMALVIERELKNAGIVLYDYTKGGADFIFRFHDGREIVFEIGFGKEKINQVQKTMQKTQNRAKYGIVIGSNNLELVDDIIKVPLEYFLLI